MAEQAAETLLREALIVFAAFGIGWSPNRFHLQPGSVDFTF